MKKLLSLRILVLAIIVAGIISFALWLRAASGEDAWLCVDGQWIKHGNPAEAMPDVPCTQATIPSSNRVATLPTADQPMTRFAGDGFSFSYPDWPDMNQGVILEPERTALAVSNAGCALVVTSRQIPANEDFQAALERLLSEQVVQSSVRILQKDITPKSSHVVGEFTVQDREIHSDQYGYVTSGNLFYSVVFAAEKQEFSSACLPFIADTVKSVEIQ